MYQPGSYGAFAPFGHVAVVQQVQGNRIYISEASFPYDTIIYHRWTGISGVQFIHHKGYGAPVAPTPPPQPQPTATPPPGSAPPANRQAITSYNRMQPGAPYHGFFTVAWQPFTAQSNTLTAVGVTVGNPTLTAGAAVPYTVTVRLCSAQPGSDGSCPGQLVEVHPQIVNYGNSAGDIGDVAVTPGATYWIEYLQPTAANGQSWVTYWWAGGSSISSSDQMQAVVQGYNR